MLVVRNGRPGSTTRLLNATRPRDAGIAKKQFSTLNLILSWSIAIKYGSRFTQDLYMTRVVVFIPGIMGSTLFQGTMQVWPGILRREALFGLRGPRFNALLDPKLTVGDVFWSFKGVPVYREVIPLLNGCGYFENNYTLYFCPYDWRKSNEESAHTLSTVIEKVGSNHNYKASITLVAHSMGGLVARYYLESDDFKDNPGYSLVSDLYALGSPHLGAPVAVIRALGHEKMEFLSKSQIQRLSSVPGFSSLYELFPPDDEPANWHNPSLPPVKPENALDTPGLPSPHNVGIARGFHSKLKRPVAQLDRVRYFFFAGTTVNTISNIWHDPVSSSIVPGRRDAGGDGTVPVWSASPGLVQREYVGKNHMTMFRDFYLRYTLELLLKAPAGPFIPSPIAPPGGGAATIQTGKLPPNGIQVTIDEFVVEPNQILTLQVKLGQPQRGFRGRILVERAITENEEEEPRFEVVSEDGFFYEGGIGADQQQLRVAAPSESGGYRITVTLSNFEKGGQDYFFVQEFEVEEQGEKEKEKESS
jgi:phospholipase A1